MKRFAKRVGMLIAAAALVTLFAAPSADAGWRRPYRAVHRGPGRTAAYHGYHVHVDVHRARPPVAPVIVVPVVPSMPYYGYRGPSVYFHGYVR